MKNRAGLAAKSNPEDTREKNISARATGSLSYGRAYAEAMERYHPSRIRLLFIAEAPPAYRFHRFFYFADVRQMDTLFLETMKTLYPAQVGYHGGQFLPGYSAAAIRRRKAELLARFQADGFYLIDGHELPMPEAAASNEKADLMRASLPHLAKKIQQLSGNHPMPVLLIGKLTYNVCATALLEGGFPVLNKAAIDHPARGGQRRFREGLVQYLASFLPLGMPRLAF
jgi:hypothetical protein